MKLPIELIYEICKYINFNNVVCLFPKIAIKFYDKRIHTWKWASKNKYIEVMKWLFDKHLECKSRIYKGTMFFQCTYLD